MDTKKRKAKGSNTCGLLSLEASIALTLFLFVMLFMYSFLVVFEARNEVAHVLLTTADSLALDAFANEAMADESSIQGVLYEIYGNYSDSNGLYTDASKWYNGNTAQIQETIETRFAAYLSGGDGDEADHILRSLNIVGGSEGLDFTGSYIDEKDRLHVVVRYTLEYEFNMFGLGTVEMEQSACSKLWKG